MSKNEIKKLSNDDVQKKIDEGIEKAQKLEEEALTTRKSLKKWRRLLIDRARLEKENKRRKEHYNKQKDDRKVLCDACSKYVDKYALEKHNKTKKHLENL